jgi:hypothetical protein
MMPSYNPSDFYSGSMAPPTSSNGMLTPTTQALGNAVGGSVPSANGTLDYTKNQSQLPPNPMQANPALDAIATQTGNQSPYDFHDWGQGLGFSNLAYYGMPSGGLASLPSGSDQVDPWGGMRVGGGLARLPSKRAGMSYERPSNNQSQNVTIATGKTVPVGTTGTQQGGRYTSTVQSDGSIRIANTKSGKTVSTTPGPGSGALHFDPGGSGRLVPY